MEGVRGALILTLIGEAGFLTLIGETDFLILFVAEEDTQVLMSLEFLLLMVILILDHPCFGLIKLISYLTWRVFLWKFMSSLWLPNLKEEERHGGINCKTSVCTKESIAKLSYVPRETTYKNVETDETAFTGS